eukprot:TRINITY_DN93054_c0_g1_i1.p1 TRINITY_DN93054_c0_g1~~TRINITY_DN93054_c0_g1_i1.p1  ORF type:complete len:864 (+),score=105.25 TRINITY_DN93054_c0_g1_i1:124-2715(+)
MVELAAVHTMQAGKGSGKGSGKGNGKGWASASPTTPPFGKQLPKTFSQPSSKAGAAKGGFAAEGGLALLRTLPGPELLKRLADERLNNKGLDIVVARLKDEHLLEDSRDCTKVLKAYTARSRWMEACSFVAHMIGAMLDVNTIVCGACIAACAGSAEWTQALAWMEFMESSTIPLNTIVCNTCISACEKAAAWQQAALLFYSMPLRGCSQDKITYSAMISALEKGGEWRRAVGLLFQMGDAKLDMYSVAFCAAITSCGKAGEWERALALMAFMHSLLIDRSAVAYTSVMEACRAAGHWTLALDLLGDMHATSTRADAIAYSAAMTSSDAEHTWSISVGLLASAVSKGLQATLTASSGAMTACVNALQWQRAQNAFLSMQEALLPVDVIAYNSILTAYARAGRWQSALHLLGEMRRSGPSPDAVSYSAVLAACQGSASWSCASVLFEEMKSIKIKLDTVVYNARISALASGGFWPLSLATLGDIADSGMIPSDSSFSEAVSAHESCSLWKQVVSLLRRSEQRRSGIPCSDSFVFSATLSTMERVSLWQSTVSFIHSLCERRAALSGIDYGCMMSASGSGGQSELAIEYFERLCDDWQGGSSMDGQAIVRVCDELERSARSFQVLAAGIGIVAVFKPPGCDSETYLRALATHCRKANLKTDISVVSRLDYMTSGVLVAAVGEEHSIATHLIRAQFSGRLVSKVYLCLARGPIATRGSKFTTKHSLTETSLGDSVHRVSVADTGRHAETVFSVVAHFIPLGDDSVHTLLAARPRTGRTHQIRAHLASIGRPIVADSLYGMQVPFCTRLFLHCQHLTLRDAAGERFVAASPLPQDLLEALDSMMLLQRTSKIPALAGCYFPGIHIAF